VSSPAMSSSCSARNVGRTHFNVYRRTRAFRAEPFNAEAQRIAAEFLQGLALAWCRRRDGQRESHAGH